MLSSLSRRALSIVLATGLAGCILLVQDPGGIGPHCGFTGNGTACGACIVRSCQAQIDQCCGSQTCAANLGALDTCASSADCHGLASGAPDVAACVASSCPACGSIDGGARDGATSEAGDARPRFSTDCGGQ